MTKEITNKGYGDTFNYWSDGTLSKFKEESRNALRNYKKKKFGHRKL